MENAVLPVVDEPSTLPLSVAAPPLPGEPVLHTDTAITLSDGQRSRRFGPIRRLRVRQELVRSDRCLNCGAYPMVSRFCSDCGQENISFKVPLPTLLHDVGEEFVKWDGRLSRTILFLLFRPGMLTDEYNRGRRTHYLPPFKMYFVASAIFVALLSVLNPINDEADPTIDGVVSAAFKKAEQNAKREAVLEAQRSAAKRAGKPIPFPAAQRATKIVPPIDLKEKPKIRKESVESNIESLLANGIEINGYKLPLHEMRYNGHSPEKGQYAAAFDQWVAAHRSTAPSPRLQKVIRHLLRVADRPGSIISTFLGSLGKGLFFLMPFYAALLALFYRTPKRFYIEHLIFAVHLHTFAFVLGALIVLAHSKSEVVANILLLAYPVYEFLALRRIYGGGKRRTLFKQWLLNQLYGWVLILGFLIILAFTVLFL